MTSRLRLTEYDSFFERPIRPSLCFASSPGVTSSSGGDTGGGSGAGGGGAAPAPAAPASGTPSGNTSGTPGATSTDTGAGAGAGGGGRDANIQQLRQNYERYQTYGKPEQIEQYKQVFEAQFNAIKEMGTNLGYSEEALLKAFVKNPDGVRDFLTQKAAEAEAANGGGTPDEIQERIQAAIDRAISPIHERENMRMTTEAQSRVDRVSTQEINNYFKSLNIDPSKVDQVERETLAKVGMELLKYNEKGLVDVKNHGKNAPVVEAIKAGIDFMNRYYISRQTRERGASGIGGNTRGQGGPPAPGAAPGNNGGGGKKPTLDEMINNPGLLGDKYK